MTKERIVSTNKTGGVVITIPLEWGISALMHGGAWDEYPWWFWIVQFNRMLSDGVPARAAYRYARTMKIGGVTRREAIEIIMARDTANLGTAAEIIDVSELPNDLTHRHRNSWRRSANGGPIWIDETLAQQIDEQRMWAQHETA